MAAGRGERALGSPAPAARGGPPDSGSPEQERVDGALRPSARAAAMAGDRLAPRDPGPLPAVAGGGRVARVRRGDAGPAGHAEALAGRDGAGAPVPTGPAGESALRGRARDRAQGGRSLPERHGRVGGTGRGGGEVVLVHEAKPGSLRSPCRGLARERLRGRGAAGCRCGRSTERRLTGSGCGSGRS